MNTWKSHGPYEALVSCDKCGSVGLTIEFQNDDSGECFYICDDCQDNWMKDKKLCTNH